MQNSINRKGFMNIQLFAEPAQNPEPPAPAPAAEPPVAEPPASKTYSEADYLALKKLNETRNAELAEKNKILRALQDKDKTAEQLAADAKLEHEQTLKRLTDEANLAKLEVNKFAAISLTAAAKAKINLDAKSTELDDLVSALTNGDKEVTTKNATALNKLLLAVYAKGAADATLDEMNKSGEGLKSGGENNSVGKSKWAKEFSDKNKAKTDIFSNLIK